VKRCSGPISRGPEGDRVAGKVGVVQTRRVNDQTGIATCKYCGRQEDVIRHLASLYKHSDMTEPS